MYKGELVKITNHLKRPVHLNKDDPARYNNLVSGKSLDGSHAGLNLNEPCYSEGYGCMH